jgi:hypothetical protein
MSDLISFRAVGQRYVYRKKKLSLDKNSILFVVPNSYVLF